MLRIAGGRVYDPANGVAGELRDVCVQDGKIVADVPAHARRIDARGMVVMPGGVDIHAHIAGPAVNAARKLAPEQHRADVLAWQTGYPAAVSFAAGHPRSSPGELSAPALLERGEVDAALVVASDPLQHLSGAAADHLRELPTVVIDARATTTSQAARVAFATAADDIEVPGTVHRMDGVPIPLRAPLPTERPGVEDVLAAIGARL